MMHIKELFFIIRLHTIFTLRIKSKGNQEERHVRHLFKKYDKLLVFYDNYTHIGHKKLLVIGILIQKHIK